MVNNSTLRELLSASSLSGQQQYFLLTSAQRLTFDFGEVIATEQDKGNLYLLESGAVRLSSPDWKDRRLNPGDFFGETPELRGVWKARVSQGPVAVLVWKLADWPHSGENSIAEIYTRLFGQVEDEPSTLNLPVFDEAHNQTRSKWNYLPSQIDYPYIQDENSIVACLAMLSQHYLCPLKKDDIRRYVPSKSLDASAMTQAADKLGFVVRRIHSSAEALESLSLPALGLITPVDDIPPHWIVLYDASQSYITVADPFSAVPMCQRWPKEALTQQWEGQLWQIELAQKQEKFDLSWFWPSVWRYRDLFGEVLIASFSLQILGLLTPIMTQVIIDKVMVQGNLSTLDVMTLGLIGVAVFEAVLSILRLFIFSHTTRRIDLRLSAQVFRHLMMLPLTYFERRKVGDTVARVQELGDIRQFLTSTALTVALDSLFAVVYLAVMVAYSVKLTLTALVVLPLFIILILVSTPMLRRTLDETFNRNAERQAFLVETLTNINAVKAHTAELPARGRWEGLVASFVRSDFRANTLSNITSNIGKLFNSLSYLCILWVGARLVIDQKLTIGQLVAFQMLSGRAIQPILGLVQLWQEFQQVLLSVDRIGDILNSKPESQPEEGLNVSRLSGRVKFESVTFSYDPMSRSVLNNVSFEVEPGELIGIVGKSGSGKSTLSKLLQRLYIPNEGRILVDNQDIQGLSLTALRQQMGVVLQDDLLFSGSIIDNITLGKTGVKDEQIVEAAHMAVADQFINRLPRGYNTPVGERGYSLSGGERQRIALARLFLLDSPIIILDEATSALDSETESRVLANIRNVYKDRTVIMITHRFSPLKQANKIIVLNQGVLDEIGTHQELIDKRGLYWTLFEIQKRNL